jgi:hypothetical protein
MVEEQSADQSTENTHHDKPRNLIPHDNCGGGGSGAAAAASGQ